MSETFVTPLTELFGIKHPILLAGMNVAAGPELAAAVTNAGGMGVIGGVGYTPEMLRQQVQEIKDNLADKSAPFGIDLLLPKVGEGARKTNYDYTGGKLPQLVDIVIESGAKLFVAAVGVPPKWAVDKLHAAGIPVMNMIGSPKHVEKALAAGCDIICAQGGEGGGHTGDVATSLLIPKVVDLCKKQISPLTGKPVTVVAAGGIYDGRGLAMALSLGADAVWVGTRFVAAEEAGAPPIHKKTLLATGYHDTIRTTIYTGRPMRVSKSRYIMDWETNKQDKIKELTAQGVLPMEWDLKQKKESGVEIGAKEMMEVRPWLMGQTAGAIEDIKPAKEIVDSMISEAIATLRGNVAKVQVVQDRKGVTGLVLPKNAAGYPTPNSKL
mmetsp:Transcript_19166/g.44059  ORF Transcript_19166/g.44059 Transcript_19166/m.44059 type:complete len:382 (+) Transcript_19166:76-1221(+)